MELSCPYRPPCPGCPRFGDEGLPESALRSLNSLRLHPDAGPVTRVSAAGPGYRHRVRLSVRSYGGRPRLGLFELGSHDLVPIEGCLLHHSSIRMVLECLEESLGRFRISPYDEVHHTGLLRAVELAASRTSGQVQAVFVLNDALGDLARAARPLEGVLKALSELGVVHGIFLNAQPLRTNTLLGPCFERLSGPPALEQETLGVRNFFPPGAFGQANPELHERVIETMAEWVPEGARVVEYHAGVGTVGLALRRLRALSSLTMNEISPPSLTGLRMALAVLGEPPDVRVAEGPASAHTHLVSGADVVIVDPPRKGLEPALLEALCADAPARLIYLSCGLPALLREAQELARTGLLPHFVGAYSYFPFTEHVETLVVFDREGNARPGGAQG